MASRGKDKRDRIKQLRAAYNRKNVAKQPGTWYPGAGQTIIGNSIPVDWTNWNSAYPTKYLGGQPQVNYMPAYGPNPQAGYMNQANPYQYTGQSGYTPGFAYAPQPTGYAGGTPQAGYSMNPNVYDPTMTASIPGGYTPPAQQQNSQYWSPDYSTIRATLGSMGSKDAPGWYAYDPTKEGSQTFGGSLQGAQNTGLSNAMYYSPYYGYGGIYGQQSQFGASPQFATGQTLVPTVERLQESLNSTIKNLQNFQYTGKSGSYTAARSGRRLKLLKRRKGLMEAAIKYAGGGQTGSGVQGASSGQLVNMTV